MLSLARTGYTATYSSSPAELTAEDPIYPHGDPLLVECGNLEHNHHSGVFPLATNGPPSQDFPAGLPLFMYCLMFCCRREELEEPVPETGTQADYWAAVAMRTLAGPTSSL